MDVTALCSTLLINALIFLVAEDQFSCAERADATSLRILPNKLQFFEYDSISCDCEGFDNFTEWRVMRTMKGVKTTCAAHWETSWGPCLIQHAYPLDSGEYWCETKEGEKSNSVFISVTAGSVILESPALPVTEGDAVTLRCKNRMTSSDCIADFYKNGSRTGTGYKGNITIHNVSKSDEGLYKCIIADEESAESWLAVRVSPSLYEETHPRYSCSSGLLLLIITLSSCLATLLLLGFCLCAEHRDEH
ncbi:low affinity immunoglobulin gamma Fc region receptor II-like [Plectropomus leopardus]|uniref:low affinity immunoglobulin gamma Fc region receptor II-like n=1 Tax=Plectropomus leopardus TaxID=160734 RepID=UPI001C4CF95B|nr:low affinity immunoglobulin gamma Fc region receptor II-like [Plectropomus leopardus]